MATVVSAVKRNVPDLLSYSAAFTGLATCPCNGCAYPYGRLVASDGTRIAVKDRFGKPIPAGIAQAEAAGTLTLEGYGTCGNAVATPSLCVDFALDDGRRGTVILAAGSTDAAVTAAISAWQKANPVPANGVVGQSV